MAIDNWHSCKGVNKRTGRIKPGFRAVRGKCPVPAHDTPSVTDIVASTAPTTSTFGRSRRRRTTLGAVTIYEALRAKLGRNPTNAEIKADVERIKREAVALVASQGRLPHQKKRRRR